MRKSRDEDLINICCTRCFYRRGIFNLTRGAGVWDDPQEGMELGWAAELLWDAGNIQEAQKDALEKIISYL